ncbi:iron(III) transport system ATP-binding protein [Stella humosa]|uniref:Iron(III) transport system ATP-binding protein n=1 Tax=Stella humosa TaxID=94 RepID=A0A3N1MGL9_9PROT|nr:ABC transporter ATP-binding protein [Stella humosa]ROQ01907.1 iron(III) transport system ATP-binding protein [Stella humosa]BBK32296.1 ABC transporter ATP-binding protein [Stella humosa]
MAEVRIQGLLKKFGSVVAVDHIDLTIADGEFLTLLGPSGCGKSTTLAAVAGLDRPDGGSIRVGETVFYDSATGAFLPPERRNCGLVFQSYALWPHMTVAENCAYPLKLRRMRGAERAQRVDEALALVEMQPYAARYPHQLSGGQQQRVALARTLVYRPTILLLDEPLSNLDAKLRERARTWLAQITKKVGLTTIYVTHDQIEALALSDRIAVMREGRIAQLDTPRVIYEQPSDPFVADFIGSSNFLKGTAEGVTGDALSIRLDGGNNVIQLGLRPGITSGQRVTIAIRPERIAVLATGEPSPGDGSLLDANIVERSYLGSRWMYHLEVGATLLRVETARELPVGRVQVHVPPGAALVFAGEEAPEA